MRGRKRGTGAGWLRSSIQLTPARRVPPEPIGIRIDLDFSREAEMVAASQLRVGAVVRFEGQEYKVIGTEYRPGQGRMTGAMHARLRNLETGTIWEHAFRSELKLEELPLDKHTLEFLYADENHCCFMDPENFEQTEIPSALVGVQARFLEAGMKLAVEFVAGRPIQVLFP